MRKLDYSIQISKIFYERVLQDADITLFSPHDVPDLYDAFGHDNDKFDELYTKYENDRKTPKKENQSHGFIFRTAQRTSRDRQNICDEH